MTEKIEAIKDDEKIDELPALYQAVIDQSPNLGCSCYYIVQFNLNNNWGNWSKATENGDRLVETFASPADARNAIPTIKESILEELNKIGQPPRSLLGFRVAIKVEAMEIVT